jgi:hypothetical protein
MENELVPSMDPLETEKMEVALAYSLEMVFHDHLHQEHISAVVHHVVIPEEAPYR